MLKIYHFLGSTDELSDKIESPQSPYKDGLSPSSGLTPSGGGVQEKHLQHRSNTTVHVCWHRNASVGRKDYQMAMLVGLFNLINFPLLSFVLNNFRIT